MSRGGKNLEKEIPKSWVGEAVLLARAGASESELVNVKGVNETGVAYTYETGEMTEIPVFVPWSAVSWMRPSMPSDQQQEESE